MEIYMANGYVDPFLTAGDLGGQGMEDLYSTYTQYGNLMGAGGMDFSIGTEQFGLEAYDTTAEDRLREGFRLDYRDFTRSTGSIYSDAEKERAKVSGKIGRAGFAGGGGSLMADYQAGIASQIKDQRLGFKTTREDLMGDISGLRSDYQTDVFETYQTYLSTVDPDELPDSEAILGCYQDGLIYDAATGGCVELGELPEDWETSFTWDELEGGIDDSDTGGTTGGDTGGTTGTGAGAGGATTYCPDGKIPNPSGECEDIAFDPAGEGLMQ